MQCLQVSVSRPPTVYVVDSHPHPQDYLVAVCRILDYGLAALFPGLELPGLRFWCVLQVKAQAVPHANLDALHPYITQNGTG